MEMHENAPKLTISELLPTINGNNRKEEKLKLRHRLVAEYAARGLPPDMIGHEIRLTPARVRQVLKDERVIKEINRITAEIFQEGDRYLAHLFRKALAKLDSHLEDPNADIRDKAIDKTLKCHRFNRDGGIVGRLFSNKQKEPLIADIDALITRRRRERGMEP